MNNPIIDLNCDEEEKEEKEEIINKNGLLFLKYKNYYHLEYSLSNPILDLREGINNLSLLYFILNKASVFLDKIEFLNKDSYNLSLIVLVKHLFEDLGVPQYYYYIDLQKYLQEKDILFNCSPIKNINKSAYFPENAQELPLELVKTKCSFQKNNIHSVKIIHQIWFQKNYFFLSIFEKIVGMILPKLFKKIKQLIENINNL